MALISIEEWCLSNDLDQSLRVAQTLKVLEGIVAEEAHTVTVAEPSNKSTKSQNSSTQSSMLLSKKHSYVDKRFAIK